MLAVVTDSAAGTEAVGAELAPFLSEGDFIALTGELGAGKTCFVRGLAAGIGVGATLRVTSPTYTLMNVYPGRLPLYHFDLYRLSAGDTVDLGFEDYFYGNGIAVVEWAERMDYLPDERLEIVFSYEGDERRRLDFSARGERMEESLRRFFSSSQKY